jgi:hypothetical protein
MVLLAVCAASAEAGPPGKAVGSAKVKVKGKKGAKTTGSSGKASLSLAPGSYKVTASKKSYASLSKRVRVK